MNPEVTSIGDINVDVITSKIGDMPGRDSQILVHSVEFSSGGCAANFAKALSRLGTPVRFVGRVGDDFFGNFLRSGFGDVDLRLSVGDRTGVTVGITFEDDTRSFLTYPGSNSGLTVDGIDLELIEGRCLHIASFFLQGLRENTKEILDFAHGRGMITSFDTGWDPGGWSSADRDLVKDVLPGVDLFFPNVKEGRAITGVGDERTICRRLLDLGLKLVALKCGKKGCCIASEDAYSFVPSFRVDSVDTTGAGDVFDAAFVYGFLKDWDLERIGRFANAAAALSTTGYGTQQYPTLEDVEKLLVIKE